MSCLPEETLIVDDSPYGLLAASRSKAHVLRVKNPTEVTHTNIFKKLKEIEMGKTNDNPKWEDKKLNILIPMAGAGSNARLALTLFQTILPWVSMAPFGKPVVPEVYIINSVSWGDEDAISLTGAATLKPDSRQAKPSRAPWTE